MTDRRRIRLLALYGGDLDPDKDEFGTGSGYDLETRARAVAATVPEADLPRVLLDLGALVGLTVKMKVDRDWVTLPGGSLIAGAMFRARHHDDVRVRQRRRTRSSSSRGSSSMDLSAPAADRGAS